jgi:methylase of polypeptide subunit release factors
MALDGGPSADGLDYLREICDQAAPLLRSPGGFLALETAGPEQVAALEAYLETAEAHRGRWQDVLRVADYYGVVRFLTARRARAG